MIIRNYFKRKALIEEKDLDKLWNSFVIANNVLIEAVIEN